MAYRARVVSSEAAANGDLHLDCFIEKQLEDESWELVPNGHRTLVLNGAAVLTITSNEAYTIPQKHAALAALFRETAMGWGIDEADEANTSLDELVTFPVNVNL